VHLRTTLALTASALTLTLTATAEARCPEDGSPSASVCEPFVAVMMPSLTGVAYFPRATEIGPAVGGGLELLFITWSSNDQSFGPGQGKIYFDVAGLDAPKTSTAFLYFRGGMSLGFERSPSRSYLIPHFGAGVGGIYTKDLGTHGFMDPTLGIYLLYVQNFILDTEGSYLLPFTSFEALSGPKASLTASIGFW